MTQKSIKKFFKNRRVFTSSSETDEDETSEAFKNINNISYYEEMLQKTDEFKKLIKVVVRGNGSSECWKYFGDLYLKKKHIVPAYKFCKICVEEGVLKGFGKSTSTTNCLNHLRAAHNLNVKSLNFKRNLITTQKALESPSSSNKFKIGRRIAEMCCWDLQPFKIVERPGFRKFVEFLSPKLVLPTDRTISTSALDDVYNIYMGHVKTVLDTSPNNICLVLDMWSDRYKRLSYINIKIHYCKDFEMNVITLKTEIFPRPHTGLAVAQKIEDSLKEFSINNKILCAVTDGGSNIISALKTINITRFGCNAHSLHRFLTHDILNNERFSQINDIILKLKHIYRSLLYSTEEIAKLKNLENQTEIANIILEAENIIESFDIDSQFLSGDDNFLIDEKSLKFQNTTLKNSVATRWNSLQVMISSFIKNINVINIALLRVNQEPLIIPDMEKLIIKEFGKFLNIFENSTKYLQGQTYPTIGSIIYFYESILSSIAQLEKDSCFDLTIQLCDFSREHIQKRFKITKLHVVASLMDPCQKNWKTLESYIKKIPYNAPLSFELIRDVDTPTSKEKIISEEIRNLAEPALSGQIMANVSAEPCKKSQKISSTRQHMLEFLGTSGPDQGDEIEQEIIRYIDHKVEETETLDWWQEHKQLFPNVSKVANLCFGIPATSSSSEQAFSFAGNCVNEKRSSLNPGTIKKQLFVHDNMIVVAPFLK